MELLALDADFEPVRYLPYINLQWTREYYTAGQYSVQVAAGDYDPRMAYLYTPERPEMGIIHKVERTENIKGRFIQISGYFLERLLWDKILWPTYYASGGTIPEAVTAMIQQYKGDIPLLEVLDAPAVSTLDTAVWQETGGELGNVAYKQLQTVACSLRCRYDYNANKIYCGVWQGTDRTQGQTANPFVTFADSFGNLISAEASRDKSNYKNYAIIAGQDKAENRIGWLADTRTNYDKTLPRHIHQYGQGGVPGITGVVDLNHLVKALPAADKPAANKLQVITVGPVSQGDADAIYLLCKERGLTDAGLYKSEWA